VSRDSSAKSAATQQLDHAGAPRQKLTSRRAQPRDDALVDGERDLDATAPERLDDVARIQEHEPKHTTVADSPNVESAERERMPRSARDVYDNRDADPHAHTDRGTR
jgi:hypothetical protein